MSFPFYICDLILQYRTIELPHLSMLFNKKEILIKGNIKYAIDDNPTLLKTNNTMYNFVFSLALSIFNQVKFLIHF